MTSPSARAEFVESLAGTSHEAVGSLGAREVWLQLDRHTVRLVFAGDALVTQVARALAHLQVEPQERADLTVWLWDSVSTGTRMPAPPWGRDAYLAQGKIRGFFGDGLLTVFERGSNALTVLDAVDRRAFFWIRDARELPYLFQGAPLRTLFHLWLAELGDSLVHAAAVGDERGCALIVGPAGAGKSTASVACLRDGLGFVGDDHCFLTEGCQPSVGSLYSSAKLWPDSLAALDLAPQTAGDGQRPGGEKTILFLHEIAPDAMLAGGLLRAVVIPRVSTGDATATRPATPSEALAAAGPSTLLQLPGTGQSSMTTLASAFRSAPCWFLDIGHPHAAARAISALLG